MVLKANLASFSLVVGRTQKSAGRRDGDGDGERRATLGRMRYFGGGCPWPRGVTREHFGMVENNRETVRASVV